MQLLHMIQMMQYILRRPCTPQRPAQKGLRWEEPSYLGYPHDKTRTRKSGNPQQKEEKTAVPDLTTSMNTGSASASEAAKLVTANFLWYSIFTKTCTLQNYLPLNSFKQNSAANCYQIQTSIWPKKCTYILMLVYA